MEMNRFERWMADRSAHLRAMLDVMAARIRRLDDALQTEPRPELDPDRAAVRALVQLAERATTLRETAAVCSGTQQMLFALGKHTLSGVLNSDGDVFLAGYVIDPDCRTVWAAVEMLEQARARECDEAPTEKCVRSFTDAVRRTREAATKLHRVLGDYSYAEVVSDREALNAVAARLTSVPDLAVAIAEAGPLEELAAGIKLRLVASGVRTWPNVWQAIEEFRATSPGLRDLALILQAMALLPGIRAELRRELYGDE